MIDKRPHKEILSKPVVTKEGRRLGIIKDITFETRTGELIHIVLKDPTPYCSQLNLEYSKKGEVLIPYNSIIAIGDFVVISEEDLM
ncbi:PRC-barrel domain-containing protein [Candidatus Pacearchaeota archaeon]|nr:PRC-barrel domain-containing protein [Candidatus Pacearchaeota archaeon]